MPSPLARAVAFGAVVLAGTCGGLIGWAFVDLQCTGECGTWSALAALVGALAAAGGVGVVAHLALRAMTEWQADQRRRRAAQERRMRRNPSA
ncbi:MAG: hypothetical protein KatS3mg008_0054 [Acidimicrobiales bacterium]|nr:MAG: hypothetical protein KatS3mg008_0054 [Acidimicrobiales bacterium]